MDRTIIQRSVLLTWTSPSRLFKKRDKEYFTNVGAIVFLLIVILLFAREFLLIAAVVSIVFLIYVLSTVPPEDVSHSITTLGIESMGHVFRWEELSGFWFEHQWDQSLLQIQPILGARITILLGRESKEKVGDVMAKYITFHETPQKSWVDNASTWLSEKVPLEKPTR